MKNIIPKHRIIITFAGLLAGILFLLATPSVRAQDIAATLPPGVQDVVKLTHAGISEDIILAQIKNSGAMYNLTADQIIYLSNQGISQTVIKSLLPGGGSAAPTMPAPVSPPPVVAPSTPAPVASYDASTPVTMAGFQTQLAPYGSWINVPGYGLCWQPAVAGSSTSSRSIITLARRQSAPGNAVVKLNAHVPP